MSDVMETQVCVFFFISALGRLSALILFRRAEGTEDQTPRGRRSSVRPWLELGEVSD